MRERYSFFRGLVFIEYRVVGAPLEVQIPVYDVSVGRGFPICIYQAVVRTRDNITKAGLSDRYDANRFAVVVANSPAGFLEDGDRITIIGRLVG